MKLGRIVTASLIFFFTQFTLDAQVQFQLDLDADTKIYTVSMLPQVTWEPPYNRTATAQITVKAPTGLFTMKEFMSLTPNVEWIMNSRVDSPAEAPGYDYLSFTLVTSGLEPLEFVKGTPTKLFCFTNSTNCTGMISLMDNATDAFLPPNSRNINVGNSIGVHGAKGEAYTGNVSNKAFACDYGIKPPTQLVVTDSKKEETVEPQTVKETLEAYTDIFPNPTNQQLNIKFSWDKTAGEKSILLFNNLGKQVQLYEEKVLLGDNHLTFDIAALPSGIYNVFLMEKGERIVLGKVMKVQ